MGFQVAIALTSPVGQAATASASEVLTSFTSDCLRPTLSKARARKYWETEPWTRLTGRPLISARRVFPFSRTPSLPFE